MSWYTYAIGSVAALLMLTHPNAGSHAQIPPSQNDQRSAILSDIQKSIIRTIGAQENTVEVTVATNILIVARVNSNMNNATHSARDNEATAIAGVVSKAIVDNALFKNLISLRIQYLMRSAADKDGRVVDTIEFRKDPSGAFQFHMT